MSKIVQAGSKNVQPRRKSVIFKLFYPSFQQLTQGYCIAPSSFTGRTTQPGFWGRLTFLPMKRRENCFGLIACLSFVATFLTGAPFLAQHIITTTATAGAFAIATEKGVSDIIVDEHDHALVKKACKNWYSTLAG